MNNIDNTLWNEAIRQMGRYPGMGSIKLVWNPYESTWICRVDYADKTFFEESPLM